VPALPTPSQTVGPFFHFALDGGEQLVGDGEPGALRVEGTVFDGAGDPVPDAMVELWQANRHGRYAHPADDRDELPLEPGFTGFGRSLTDPAGRFRFVTVKPGRVPGGDGQPQAPHLELAVFARGLLRQVITRMYFPDEAEANASDPVLASIDDPDRRATLVARAEDGMLAFDVRLQGERATVLFGL
jgi:protocatechuate 3,4-dioxygenase alpha subunit